jgi:hypothetical protein
MIILVQCRPSWISDHHQKNIIAKDHIVQQVHQSQSHSFYVNSVN